ncbi:hypothetical protein [Klebsiella pneumoniae]|uniref:hypothetical protein n=1 Tax=Klebsiella pneumoniae TaxID=573 RepID=UPI0032DA636D
MTNNQLIGERLSDSDLEHLVCELEAAGFYRRQLICLVELQERRKAAMDSEPVDIPEMLTPVQASRAYCGEVRGYRDGWNACRAAMLNAKAEPVRDEFPSDEIECDICGHVSTDPEGRHHCCEDNSND